MPNIPPITDELIDQIIKANELYDPNSTVTQGVKLRELMKQFRDYLEQQTGTNGGEGFVVLNPSLPQEGTIELTDGGRSTLQIEANDEEAIYMETEGYGSVSIGIEEGISVETDDNGYCGLSPFDGLEISNNEGDNVKLTSKSLKFSSAVGNAIIQPNPSPDNQGDNIYPTLAHACRVCINSKSYKRKQPRKQKGMATLDVSTSRT